MPFVPTGTALDLNLGRTVAIHDDGREVNPIAAGASAAFVFVTAQTVPQFDSGYYVTGRLTGRSVGGDGQGAAMYLLYVRREGGAAFVTTSLIFQYASNPGGNIQWGNPGGWNVDAVTNADGSSLTVTITNNHTESMEYRAAYDLWG